MLVRTLNGSNISPQNFNGGVWQIDGFENVDIDIDGEGARIAVCEGNVSTSNANNVATAANVNPCEPIHETRR